MKRRDANLVLVALGAFGGAVVAGNLPLVLVERLVGAIGLSALVPALAPPLGPTAQLLFVGAAAVLCALLVMTFLPLDGQSQAEGKRGETMMSFLFSKIAVFARGHRGDQAGPADPSVVEDGESAPALRRQDAHPDAPARAPLQAKRELGQEAALPPVDDLGDDAPGDDASAVTGLASGEAEQADQDAAGPPAPTEPLPWDMIEQEMSRVLKGVELRPHEEDGAGTEPSLKELADRLERGLARRRVRVYGETGVPGVARGDDETPPPRGSAESEEDLEQALAALRKITQRAG